VAPLPEDNLAVVSVSSIRSTEVDHLGVIVATRVSGAPLQVDLNFHITPSRRGKGKHPVFYNFVWREEWHTMK